MLIKFLSWCCGVDIPQLLAENTKLRDERDEYVTRIIKLERDRVGTMWVDMTTGKTHARVPEDSHIADKIKLLEDNAFADRAKIIKLENKIEELEQEAFDDACRESESNDTYNDRD